MPPDNTSRLLDQLDELKTEFTRNAAQRIEGALARLARKKLYDTDTLFRYHELLLFIRAYAHNASVVHSVERELRGFANRVAFLERQGADLTPLQHPEW